MLLVGFNGVVKSGIPRSAFRISRFASESCSELTGGSCGGGVYDIIGYIVGGYIMGVG